MWQEETKGNSSTFVASHVMIKLQITAQQPPWSQTDRAAATKDPAESHYYLFQRALVTIQSILGTRIRLNTLFFMIIIISICINQWLTDN